MSTEFDVLLPFFNEEDYLNTYPDAPGSYGSGWEHFTEIGIPEHRSPSSVYDTTYFLTQGIDNFDATNQRDLVMGIEGNDTISGLGGDDGIYGGAGNDFLTGGDGNDTVGGGDLDDILNGNAGNDSLTGWWGDDTINGGTGNDTLQGGDGMDSLNGGDDPDTLKGGIGNDILNGDAGNDMISGQADDDELNGGDGNDTVGGGAGNDIINGDLGNDLLTGWHGNDTINGGNGADSIQGGDNNDLLDGGTGNDTLKGGDGDDTLTSGDGIDVFVGGLGKDEFQLGKNIGATTIAQANIIQDFTQGDDLIRLTDGLTFDDLEISVGTGNNAGDTIIKEQFTGEYVAILEEVTTIDSSDFISLLPTQIPAQIASSVIKFTPTDTEAAIAAKGGPSLTIGTQSIYIGTWQKSANNQDPIIASFDSANPANNWVRTDYEMTGADGRGYGLFWDGDDLYAVFSTDGTQGSVSEDFRRAATDAQQSWLRSYGQGGGAKVSVVASIDEITGEMTDAAFFSALLSNGNSNTLTVNDLFTNSNDNLVVKAGSFFSPRNPNGSRMTQVETVSSPFDYTVEITPDLKKVVSTAAVGWVS